MQAQLAPCASAIKERDSEILRLKKVEETLDKTISVKDEEIATLKSRLKKAQAQIEQVCVCACVCACVRTCARVCVLKSGRCFCLCPCPCPCPCLSLLKSRRGHSGKEVAVSEEGEGGGWWVGACG